MFPLTIAVLVNVNQTFQCSQARRIIGDFGIPISILVFVMIDYSISDTYTQVTSSGFTAALHLGIFMRRISVIAAT